MGVEPTILIAEDRDDDVFIIKRGLVRAQIEIHLQVVRDGEEAISYLAGSGKYSDRDAFPLPWLLLLDLKMPRLDGFDVLKWIRQRPDFKSLIVVVLTSSEDIRDVNRAYALGAN